jgi:hypothetical protein
MHPYRQTFIAFCFSSFWKISERSLDKLTKSFWNELFKIPYDYIKHNVEKQSDETF